MSDPTIEPDHDLGGDFEPLVLSCILNCKGFFDRYGPAIQSELFSDTRMRSLVQFVREYYEKFKKVPGRIVLTDLIQHSQHANPGGLIACIDELPPGEDAEYVAEKILKWLKWRAIDVVLADSVLRDDPAGFSKAVEQASRTGDDLSMQHSRLDLDREDEEIRNETMPTPWEWLNSRIPGGGPEKKDFCVALTVINGGKTTALVNIGMHAVASGKHVVFFTFEDGEAKIKRRMLQWINGWTTEEILANVAKARSRRDRFLELCGGSVHIKQLKSRRTSVDEAMAFVRNIREASGHPVDMVITDYFARFRATGRYNEPRHALREISEDCKYLATELDVVHWSASQVAKTQTGKEVVGIEHGSESTGQFESCDLAVGFGQTMEDSKRGTITLYTSKVRDGEKNQMTSLMADFATQRFFERGDARMTPKPRRMT